MIDVMNLGMPEMIFIFLLALVIFGPKKLPELGRQLGKALAEFKKASNEIQEPARSRNAEHRAGGARQEAGRRDAESYPSKSSDAMSGPRGFVSPARSTVYCAAARRACVDTPPSPTTAAPIGRTVLPPRPGERQRAGTLPMPNPVIENAQKRASEEMTGMSFLDHLEELRRRIIYSCALHGRRILRLLVVSTSRYSASCRSPSSRRWPITAWSRSWFT